MNEETYAQIKADLAANETEHKSFKRRLDEHDALLRDQGRLIAAMESLTKGMDRVEKKVDSIDGRVAVLEKEPAENWKKISFEVIKYLVIALLGLAVGYIINGLG